ncbi:MAG: N-acyl homoserine lactonase family protein [Pseudomonadota bacterium]
MTVRVRLLQCGYIETQARFIADGLPGTIRLPVPSVLIEHPRGLALFDTGLHPSIPENPERLGANQKIFDVTMGTDDDLGSQLTRLGVEASDIRYIINSHLHFDHCGGNEAIPNATVVVQKPEWTAGHETKLIEMDVYNPADYDHGHQLMTVDGEHDLFGDGSVLCVPTYGHTAGHQSLVINTDAGRTVFAADTCYLKRTLEEGLLPRFGYDLDMQRKSLDWLRQARSDGAYVVFGHDAEQWGNFSFAPQYFAPKTS